MHKITQINLILKDYFELNFSVKKVAVKNMMPYFVLGGVFKKDEKNGLPIQILLRKLEEKNQLKLIPFALADKKTVYTKWYFESRNVSTATILKIQSKLVAKKKLKK